MNPEAILARNIRCALNRTGLVRLVVNRIGFDERARCPYGLGEGSPDLIGVLKDGRVFALEVKTPKGSARESQKAWWRAAEKWNIRGGYVRSVKEAMDMLEREVMR